MFRALIAQGYRNTLTYGSFARTFDRTITYSAFQRVRLLLQTQKKRREILQANMTQKPITAFFFTGNKKDETQKTKKVIETDSEESPVKVRRKKLHYISDSENSESSHEEQLSTDVDSASKTEADRSEKTVKERPKNETKKTAAKAQRNKKQKQASKRLKLENTASENVAENQSKLVKESPSSSSNSKEERLVKENDYDPAKQKYHPIDHACWKHNQPVPYLALAKTLEAIENISARLKMTEILSNFLRSVLILTPDDLTCCVYLCLNKLAPAYEGLELGVGDMVLKKTIAQATGRTMEKLKAEIDAKGDIGLVAETCRSNQRTMFQPSPLMVRGVFAKLKEIAQMSGSMSMAKKIEKIHLMFVACRSSEARFLIRSLSGKLRIGLAEQSVLAALAQAVTLTPPLQSYPPEITDSSKCMSSDSFKKKLEEYTLLIKTSYCECPSYEKIIEVILKHGVENLPKYCYIEPGIPLKPMLAHPTKGVNEVLQRFENARFTCEFKYDGERAQIHVLNNKEVQIYSRNQENTTGKYPDVVSRILRVIKESTKSCIIDSESVAWDVEKQQILPFQILSTRKKKDANEDDLKVKVCVFAFDLLYLNGESLVKKAFEERRRLLKEAFQEIPGEFEFVKAADSNNVEEIAEFLEEAVKGKCEGLMVKTLDVDATYEIAKRSHNWLKLKKDYLEGVGDTLDVIVIGGYYGKGKRTGIYGGFLLACYDEENEEFQSICKIGTGFKDEDLETHSNFFKQHLIDQPKSYYRYDPSLKPDEWFEPVQVWEIKCADLSISPIHKAGLGIIDEEKGISLRFPRFLRIREDKSPENATSASQVVNLYKNQEQVKNQSSGKGSKEEEDEELD